VSLADGPLVARVASSAPRYGPSERAVVEHSIVDDSRIEGGTSKYGGWVSPIQPSTHRRLCV